MRKNEIMEQMTENEIHSYKEGLGELQHKMPELVGAYHQFTERCFEDGEISKKDKHLIALGISLYAQDEYCIHYHTKGCFDQGGNEKEILDVIGVAAAMGGGIAMSRGVQLVKEQLKEHTALKN